MIINSFTTDQVMIYLSHSNNHHGGHYKRPLSSSSWFSTVCAVHDLALVNVDMMLHTIGLNVIVIVRDLIPLPMRQACIC